MSERYAIVETTDPRAFVVVAYGPDGETLGGDYHWLARVDAERAMLNYITGRAIHGHSTERQALRGRVTS